MVDVDQVTNIAIKIGEAQQKADFAIWVAVIAAVGAVAAALVAGYFKLQFNKAQKEHDKQWAYVAKKSSLIDSAIEVGIRMMYNKLILAHYPTNAEAALNLFVLSKDGLVVESQMVVYGSQEMATAFSDFREAILSCPSEQFLSKWSEIYKKGQECLSLCRQSLGVAVTESFKQFQSGLQQPPSKEQTPVSAATTMGSITLTQRNP